MPHSIWVAHRVRIPSGAATATLLQGRANVVVVIIIIIDRELPAPLPDQPEHPVSHGHAATSGPRLLSVLLCLLAGHGDGQWLLVMGAVEWLVAWCDEGRRRHHHLHEMSVSIPSFA